MEIQKRDGRKTFFDPKKIKASIIKSLYSIEEDSDPAIVEPLFAETVKLIDEKYRNNTLSTEDVAKAIGEILMRHNLLDAYNIYNKVRKERKNHLETKSVIMEIYKEITFSNSNNSDLKRENANINSDTAMGAMLKYGSEGVKTFNKLFLLKKEFAEAHDSGLIHIHDLDFYSLTTTCCQINLTKLFSGGFHTGHGAIREPQDIKTYASLACIAIQSNQNDQHGGQSVPNFDFDMAPGVKKTYKKYYTKYLSYLFKINFIEDNAKAVLEEIKLHHNITPEYKNNAIEKYLPYDKAILTYVAKFAEIDTENDTLQAMESLIHNLNTMHSRAGAQVPFSSINYGLDTSPEGRLVVLKLLEATIRGLGNGETPIFPIQIYKLKEGINYNPEDPNYDIFLKTIECTSKRLFPNYAFIDSPFNLQYYKADDIDTHIAYMGCRTRVIANIDKANEKVSGRGNLSFTSINLPRIALESKNIDIFFAELDRTADIVINQLLERFNVQKKLHVYNFPFLMGQGIWKNSDKLSRTDSVEEVLKQGTLTVGFIGLAEALKVLLGVHHGESEEAQLLGLKIIKFLREKTDEATSKYNMNFSLIATPAEGLSGRFVKIDKRKFGIIKGVTDRDYYTNSFHIPVYYTISAAKKISLEAPYHALTNGGHITYVELDGDASKNPEAILKIIQHMKNSGIGYGSINHALDFDPLCGYNGIIGNECPSCHREETIEQPFTRIRRITGYLVGGLDFFNDAKKAEVKERVKHNIKN